MTGAGVHSAYELVQFATEKRGISGGLMRRGGRGRRWEERMWAAMGRKIDLLYSQLCPHNYLANSSYKNHFQ